MASICYPPGLILKTDRPTDRPTDKPSSRCFLPKHKYYAIYTVSSNKNYTIGIPIFLSGLFIAVHASQAPGLSVLQSVPYASLSQ